MTSQGRPRPEDAASQDAAVEQAWLRHFLKVRAEGGDIAPAVGKLAWVVHQGTMDYDLKNRTLSLLKTPKAL
jgi:hypothetical protein